MSTGCVRRDHFALNAAYSWDETLQRYRVEFEGSQVAMVNLALPPFELRCNDPSDRIGQADQSCGCTDGRASSLAPIICASTPTRRERRPYPRAARRRVLDCS